MAPTIRLRRVLANPITVPLIVLSAAMLALHGLVPVINDDLSILNDVRNITFRDWFVRNYQTWSTRLLIDQVIWIIAHNFRVWRILNSAVYVVFFIFLVRVFGFTMRRRAFWLGLALVLVLPFEFFGTAGYLVTSITYFWPIAFGLVAGYGMKRAVLGREIRWWQYPLYLGALVFAANQEQSNLLILGVLISLIVYQLVTTRKVSWFLVVQCVIVGAMLVFILNSPGSAGRFVAEQGAWFPDFATLSAFQRLQTSYTSTFARLLLGPDFLFLSLAAVVYALVHLRCHDLLFRVVAAIPLASVIALGVLAPITGTAFPGLHRMQNRADKSGLIGVSNFDVPGNYVPLVLFGLVAVAILIATYLALDRTPWLAGLATAVLALGFVTRLAVGFSPTVYASSLRTFTFLYFAMVVVTYLCVQRLSETPSRLSTAVLPAFGGLAAMSFVNSLLLQMTL